ncbi:GTPase HflX [Acetanaerobacterium elongatum]|uniref:GTPase HflX n=1 Tax=Acetanaerobacterium elongatum TaxID=258515 RepID=A0A1H0EPS8_9FIRM|nr:GTPase HflX [Acetanaerobacterium elongatum]SDN84303.1 GTP-binding protein HflX [Acetanaerobacterium elongatum]
MAELYENKEQQRAVLAAVDTGEYDIEVSLAELSELARTAGAEVVASVTQKREAPDNATCLGSGRLAELCDFCEKNEINLVVFDHELSAAQIRNIEDIVKVRVIDRTMLILDIFAMRAVSKEGKVQVELAQQRYRLPRLLGLGTQLSRLGGGIGTRGPGETKLETDRRHIRRRISFLEEELEELTRQRQDLRKRRKKNGVLTAAIVGYTNVGKSTLLNALTDAGVLAEDKLFATLDPTARSLKLPDGRNIVLIDTVGLIRRLPHQLIEAFKSTLEEAAGADIILNVCDITSSETQTQLEVTRTLLEEIGASGIPILTVYNKCDMLSERPLPGEGRVYISAKTGEGFDELLTAVAATLKETTRRMRVTIPYAEGGLAAQVRTEGKLIEEQFGENGIALDVIVDTRTRLYQSLVRYEEQQ